jgi:hypothetical protein
MKKILIYFLFAQLVFLSCKKAEVEPVFEESANKRVTTVLDSYKKQLVGSEFGWKGVYYPAGGNAGGYTFYLKFDAMGKVSMYSDIDGFFYFPTGYDKAFETTYQVKAQQTPTLVFDSYSYLTELVNPDYNSGTGQSADLELSFQSVTADKITLVGNVNKTQMTLTKMTKVESDVLAKGGLSSVFKGTVDYIKNPKFLTLIFPTGEKTDVVIDLTNKQLGLYYINAKNEPDLAFSAFSVTTAGLQLKDAIKLYGVTIQELFWDDIKKIYYINAGTRRVDLVYSSKPSLPFYYALGNLFQGFFMSPTIPTQGTEYKALYDKIKSNVITLSAAVSPPNPPVRVLGNISLQYLPNDGVFALYIDYTRTQPDGTVVFNGAGVLFYEPSLDSRGNIKFTRLATTATYYYDFDQLLSGISGIVATGVKPLTDVIENNTFQWDYDPTADRTAVLKSNGTPSIVIKGILR